MIQTDSVENPYPKLVRDKIPEIIEAEGKNVDYHRESDTAAYLIFLFSKLHEEAKELSEAETSIHKKEELADLKEVLDAIQETLEFSDAEIAEIQAHKRSEKGGFSARLIIDTMPT